MSSPNPIPSTVVAVGDYEALARSRLDPVVWSYLAGGVADEMTLRWNREAFDRIALKGRVLMDLIGGHPRSRLLGLDLDHPILIAPLGHQGLFHADAEAATARAAAALGAVMTASTVSTLSMEAISEAGSGAPQWFQLYFQLDRGFTASLVERAEGAGYRAIVVTVDAAINGVRNREQRAGFKLPPHLSPANLKDMAKPAPHVLGDRDNLVFDGLMLEAPTWRDIEWLQARTRLPILIKGVTAAEDAEQAVAVGLAGVIVSNHGGRTLDTLAASIDLLPEIVERVAGRLPLLLDGGIRRGTDVLKALALGADAVMVGRPVLHALAAAGALGVTHMLQMLITEFEIAMVLTGCKTLADISPRVLRR